ncbi:MAG: hypothetical protein AAGF07_03665 [Patescibacteria group bacterium]
MLKNLFSRRSTVFTLVVVAVMLSYSILFTFFNEYSVLGIYSEDFNILNVLDKVYYVLRNSILDFFFILYAPLIEELIFRYPLKKDVKPFWKINSILAIFGFFYLWVFTIKNKSFEINPLYDNVAKFFEDASSTTRVAFGGNNPDGLIVYILVIPFSLLIQIYLKKNKRLHSLLNDKIFNIGLSIISSIIFIIIHFWLFNNLRITAGITLYLPLTLIFVFARLKFGMGVAIVAHSFANYILGYAMLEKFGLESFIISNIVFILGLGVLYLVYKRFVLKSVSITKYQIIKLIKSSINSLLFDYVYSPYGRDYPNVILGIIVIVFLLSYKYNFGLPIDQPFNWFYRITDSGKSASIKEQTKLKQESKFTSKKFFNRKDILATLTIIFLALGGKYGLISPYRLYPGQDRVTYTVSHLSEQDYMNFCKSKGRYTSYKVKRLVLNCYSNSSDIYSEPYLFREVCDWKHPFYGAWAAEGGTVCLDSYRIWVNPFDYN